MPRPKQSEIDTLYRLMSNLGLPLIDRSEAVLDRVLLVPVAS